MDRRKELQKILVDILGCNNVYFQPPESIKLRYPCIIYEHSNESSNFADDIPYNRTKMYDVTVIDKNPDSEIPDKIANLPMCAFNNSFKSDNLNHYVYRLYF